MTTAESLFEQALELDEAERTELADRLYESVTDVTPEWEKAWLAEAERRMADYRAGRVEAIPWEEARKILLAPIDTQ